MRSRQKGSARLRPPPGPRYSRHRSTTWRSPGAVASTTRRCSRHSPRWAPARTSRLRSVQVRFAQMRRARVITALLVTAVTLLAFAPTALARAYNGEGWYGETNDKVITNAMFLTIIFFPTVILIFSLIQWRLDKRKHARMAAAKRRAANADWRGGW